MVKLRAARKKPVVLSSESDEDDSRSPPPKRTRRGTLTSISNGAHGDVKLAHTQTQLAPSTKPSKASAKKSPTASPAKPKPVYKPITSFFSSVPRSQSLQPTPSPEKPFAPLAEVDDILDSSGDDRPSQPSTALPVRKTVKIAATAQDENVAKSRQKFLRPASRPRSPPPSSQPVRDDIVDRRPWTEKYGPVSLDELSTLR